MYNGRPAAGKEKAARRASGNKRTPPLYPTEASTKDNQGPTPSVPHWITQIIPSPMHKILDANTNKNNTNCISILLNLPEEKLECRTQPEIAKGDSILKPVQPANGATVPRLLREIKPIIEPLPVYPVRQGQLFPIHLAPADHRHDRLHRHHSTQQKHICIFWAALLLKK